ncbi:MAG: hypothetical protein MSG64_14405 [Pyrinomonadaceae bacterium MAG19_C2-C3]|nr:hypothetical protein [Pyrinomonadaceae bacterium MAG19_C2-C3]
MNLSPEWVAAFAAQAIESVHWSTIGDPCAEDELPSHLANIVIAVLRENEALLERGALIVIDEGKARVRILPLQRHP